MKTIAICGSMRFVNKMEEWKEKLESQGYNVKTPILFDFHVVRDVEGNLEKFEEIKRKETRNHFEKIKNSDAILVLNFTQEGVENYIGGNTFAEIAVAHFLGKEIYLLNQIPEDMPYTEELKAWKVKQWPK